ncbi:MAG: hypothetical protein GXY61_05765, partial [Lentisphaerae bacterium]|nr:hypothetical protein [Lentisphaerota bacterium]
MSLKQSAKSFPGCALCLPVIFLMLAGCGPSPEEIEARETRLGREIELYLNKVQELDMQGQQELAMAFLERGLQNKKFISQRERFFELKVDMMLMREEAEQVKALELDAWQNSPGCAQRVFGRVHEYYRQRQDHEAILKWGDSLLALENSLPEELHGQVWGWKLDAFVALQDEHGAKECVDRILAKVKADVSASMLQSALGGLVDGSRHDLAVTLIRYLESKDLQSEPHHNMLVTLSMR